MLPAFKKPLYKGLEPIVEILASRGTNATDPEAADGPLTELDEPEIAPLPEGWGSLPSGAPAPNWVAGLDDVRGARTHRGSCAGSQTQTSCSP